MRLNSIEIKGFKSFADKTVINFNDKITGIVGPNGCGKSNIVDAIRWVLGEQRASSLRSEKMENLIFNGTKKRRAAGIAEVTMHFENTKNILPTEYSNIAISRIYYRNGESEYRLNNTPCRLKDILSLFMDTGVGSDSYAIIELKMIDDILSDKDNSRRKLFEQAAGIEKYKIRKKETLSKLNATNNDLERVNDLLFEIETNLKTLESQARKTKKYYQLKEEYKTLSIEFAIHLLSVQKESYKGVTKELESESDKRSKTEAAIQKLESQLQVIKKASLDKEKALSDAQKALNTYLDKLRQEENQKNILHEKLKYLEEKIKSAGHLVENSQGKIKQAGEEENRLKSKLEVQSKTVDLDAKKLENLKTERDKSSENRERLKIQYQEVRSAFENIERELNETEKEVAVKKAQLENLKEQQVRAKNYEEQSKKEFEELSSQLKPLHKSQNEGLKQIESLQNAKKKAEDEIEKTNQIIEGLDAQKKDEERNLDARENEFKLTKNMLESMEGFPESIKFLKKEAKSAKDAPLVSDIFTCGEDFKIAIEQHLEPYLAYYVMDDMQAAIDSIELLSNASKGKANFFILDELRGLNLENPIAPAFCTSALEVMEVDKKYRELLKMLLNQVYIADNMPLDDLKTLWKENPDKIILSKSGKFTRKKFLLSGGSIGLFEGKKIGRTKNLEKLEKEIAERQEKIRETTEALRIQKEKREELKQGLRENTLDQVRKETEEIGRKILSAEGRLKYIEENKNSISGGQDLPSMIDALEKSVRTFNEKIINLTTLVDAQNKKKEEVFLTLETAEITYHKSTGAYNTANLAYHQEENALKTISQELEFVIKRQNDLKQEIAKGKEEAEKSKNDIEEGKVKLKELEESLIELYDIKTGAEEKVVKCEEDYYKERGGIEEIEDQIKEKQKEKEQTQYLIAEMQNRETEIKIELASLKERLQVEFKVDINALINQDPNPDYDKDLLEEKVQKIKTRLDNYGEINPMAVEAFDEMKKRYDFINDQKNDLNEAQKNLADTIREIDIKATSQFMETFHSVESHFQEVFKSLFREEDDCELILTDPSNPLDSKIEIKARPKGKRPLTINQLSGGEKSLTAIALLFSLYLIKPAPFCIFDEVDAPLDDANVAKFTEIIRKFSNNSQFIVVTHNKQTMMSTDVIYGVTMVEEGISRVVPVDFSNLN